MDPEHQSPQPPQNKAPVPSLAERVELHQLITEHSGLEQTFFALTAKADQQPDSTLKEAS